MGCSSCSTSTNATPAGCKSNGTCGTSGCNKLNVYNWLADMTLPEGQKPFDIVEVRFKGSRKEFFRNVNGLDLKVGELVAVEGNPGHDIGEVSMTGELVRFQLRKKNVKDDAADIKLLYRHARQADIDKWKEMKSLEHTTMHRSRTIAMGLGLRMKLSDVEYQGDGKKATFFYTADDRVDFRELIKKLAEEFKVRVEMRQIGMRQEASRLGGIGSCGRELCCSTWLTDFKVVSTSAARYQNLSLNPLKLAGQCGKLKCCLNYELDTYLDAIRDIPESNVKLLTGKGTLLHRKTDIFKRIMWYTLIPEPKEGEERSFVAESWVPMSVDRVKEIVAMNKLNQKPDELLVLEMEEEEEDLDYKDVVGQDSLTRMDRKKKKKKKKKKDGTQSNVAEANVQAQPNQPAKQPQERRPDSNRQQNKPQQQRQDQKKEQRPQQQQAKPQQPQRNEQQRQQNKPHQQQQKQDGNRPPRQQGNDQRRETNRTDSREQKAPREQQNQQQLSQQQQGNPNRPPRQQPPSEPSNPA